MPIRAVMETSTTPQKVASINSICGFVAKENGMIKSAMASLVARTQVRMGVPPDMAEAA